MESTWIETAETKRYPKLDTNVRVDAAIIGGGIAGTTAAYLLAEAGVRVALIDKGSLSESVTAYTTAFVRHVVDLPLVELKKLFGGERAKMIWEANREAVEMIGRHVREERIDCDYLQCPFYKFANDEAEWKEISEDADLANTYGFDLEKKRDRGIKPKNVGYYLLENQAKFHPLKYLDALRAKAVKNGALIFEATEAKDVTGIDPLVVRTAGGNITARAVLIATYEPFNKPRQLFARKGIYTTYVIECEVPHGSVDEALYEDAEDAYHYLRIDAGKNGKDRLILGGEDHRHELPLNPDKAYAALEEYLRKILPDVPYTVTRRWKGPIIETLDGRPFIGTYDDERPNLFVATGFSGSGMTYGTLAGRMFSEFAQGNPVPWKDLYDPRRKITLNQFARRFVPYTRIFFRAYVRNLFKDPRKVQRPTSA